MPPTISQVITLQIKQGRLFDVAWKSRWKRQLWDCQPSFFYFQSLPDTIEEVRYFSDRSGGQNLNQVQVVQNIKVLSFWHLVRVKWSATLCTRPLVQSLSALGKHYGQVTGKQLHDVEERKDTSFILYTILKQKVLWIGSQLPTLNSLCENE